MSIGIGITVKDRYDIFKKCVSEFLKRMPPDSDIFIVNDGSSCEVPEADQNNKESKGIAGAKNDCIRLLDHSDHIFLFDSDLYPIVDNWWVPYVESKHNHLCLSFEFKNNGQRFSNSVVVEEKRDDVWVYRSPNGMGLYMKRICWETVGGFDERFKNWGYEHVQYSHRIHNFGLTEKPFMDIPDAISMFYSYDHQGTIRSSVPDYIKHASIPHNKKILDETKDLKLYIPYADTCSI